MFYIDRHTGNKTPEKTYSGTIMKFLYKTTVGAVSRELLLTKKFLSVIYGIWQDSWFSSKKIPAFIKETGIDMNEYEHVSKYSSFNDFFIRKIRSDARKIDTTEEHIISCADGKLTVIDTIISSTAFMVKGSAFSLEDLFKSRKVAHLFAGGTAIVIRLAPADYHRYHFPCDGKIIKYKKLRGEYYSVHPFALKEFIDVFSRNRRDITLCETNFGIMGIVEIGAFGVGKIVQTVKSGVFKKGDEKGFFKFGGSTVILFFQKDCIIPDPDLSENSRRGFETKIHFGERIACIKK